MKKVVKAKITHNSRSDLRKRKNGDGLQLENYKDQLYRCQHSWQIKPCPESFIVNTIIPELRAFMVDPYSLFLAEFTDAKGISDSTWQCWLNRYPQLKAADEEARRHIARRRERGGLTRELDGNFVRAVQGMYCKEYQKFMREEALFKASLDTKQSNNQPTKLEITMLQAKDTGIPHVNAIDEEPHLPGEL